MSLDNVPAEIFSKIISEDLSIPVNIIIVVGASCKRLYSYLNEDIYWKRKYCNDFGDPNDIIRDDDLFVKYFLPPDEQMYSDWRISYIRRYKYDMALVSTIQNTDYADIGGWQMANDSKSYSPLKDIPEAATRYGFKFNNNLFDLPDDDDDDGYAYAYACEQIQWDFTKALYESVLELTFDPFLANPTARLIDFESESVKKKFHPHLAFADRSCAHLCPWRKYIHNRLFEFGLFARHSKYEYTAHPNREWGVYMTYSTNGTLYGIAWGEKFIALMAQHCTRWTRLTKMNFNTKEDIALQIQRDKDQAENDDNI